MLRLILNVLWVVFGGFEMAMGWWLAGLLFAISIIGLPWARAAFNIGLYALWPFGSRAVNRELITGESDIGTGPFGMIGNIVWFLLAGWWLALGHIALALLYAITIIGLPFAYVHLKLVPITLAPIGKTIIHES
ncbi:MAG: YccF domain-containing protein [Alphaproteobacteria bacterium]|nr:MAG: YccF domain-containing protein [Alphaproteobacteria bacterium]